QKSYVMGIIIGLSLCITVMLSATVGTLLPLVFMWLNIDPAIAACPFITTVVDVGSLLVYFSLGILVFTYFGNL
ncbi:MAG TPA: magnesium transporter, partial [Atribacterota bacterium]|nr:magnesium transporter [Atribacterota bacterium]